MARSLVDSLGVLPARDFGALLALHSGLCNRLLKQVPVFHHRACGGPFLRSVVHIPEENNRALHIREPRENQANWPACSSS